MTSGVAPIARCDTSLAEAALTYLTMKASLTSALYWTIRPSEMRAVQRRTSMPVIASMVSAALATACLAASSQLVSDTPITSITFMAPRVMLSVIATPDSGGSDGRNRSPTRRAGVELTEALYTTRAMRRVRPDPIPEEAVAAMMDAAIRAPSGGNSQNWRFITVSDPAIRRVLGPIYRRAWEQLNGTVYRGRVEEAARVGDEATLKVMRSANWLAENFEQVPLWFMAVSRNDPTGASIYPAVWSLMLAGRGLGIGTCLTTVLGIFRASGDIRGIGDSRRQRVGCSPPRSPPDTPREGGDRQGDARPKRSSTQTAGGNPSPGPPPI